MKNSLSIKQIGYLLVIIVLAVLTYHAGATRSFITNTWVSVGCAISVMAFTKKEKSWPLAMGLCISVVGDYFMAHREGKEMFFVFGITFFLIAHILYILYFLKNKGEGHLSMVIFPIIFIAYLVYFLCVLRLNITSPVLSTAVLIYIIVSSVSFATACDVQFKLSAKISTILGISMIVFSDTLIAHNNFVNQIELTKFIIPTYMMCHFFLTLGILLEDI